MQVTRRNFLSVVSYGAAGSVVARSFCAAELARGTPAERNCALLDSGGNCTFRESVRGYETALREAGLSSARVSPGGLARCRNVIVPACAPWDSGLASHLSASLRRGGWVVLESGMGFTDFKEFCARRGWLQVHFGVAVEPPVNLWASRKEGECLPYVEYTWPVRATVRDFSRAVPVAAREGEIIARVNGFGVALRQMLGKGTLVFLGSPLGPALLSGDREAQVWLRALLRAA